MKLLILLSIVCLSWSLKIYAKQAPKSAPEVLITENYGCGNNECRNFAYDAEVIKAADMLVTPGKGKKLESVKVGSKVKVLDSKNLSTRGLLKLFKDKAGGKAGSEYYYYEKDPTQGLTLYIKSGEKVESPSGNDFVSSDMLKPTCHSKECAGEVISPSKGETYMRVKTKKGTEGWVNFDHLDIGC
jgi:hypothetical protein